MMFWFRFLLIRFLRLFLGLLVCLDLPLVLLRGLMSMRVIWMLFSVFILRSRWVGRGLVCVSLLAAFRASK